MNLSIPLRINGLLEACNYPLFKTRTVYTVTTVPKEVPERLRFRSGKRNQKPAQKTVSDNPVSRDLPVQSVLALSFLQAYSFCPLAR
jgi:hypothetical protein